MNVDYDLYEGETATASVRHTFCRGTLVYDRGEILTHPGTAASSAARWHGAAASMSALELDPAAVIADLDELAEQSGGRFAGAERLAWTPEWLGARQWLRQARSDRARAPARTRRATCGPRSPGETDEFLIVGSHIDAVPDGGWLDGALGVLTALEVMRQLAASRRPAARRRALRRLGRRGGGRFSRSLIGSSAAAGTLVADDVRTLTDADGITLADALAALRGRSSTRPPAPAPR